MQAGRLQQWLLPLSRSILGGLIVVNAGLAVWLLQPPEPSAEAGLLAATVPNKDGKSVALPEDPQSAQVQSAETASSGSAAADRGDASTRLLASDAQNPKNSSVMKHCLTWGPTKVREELDALKEALALNDAEIIEKQVPTDTRYWVRVSSESQQRSDKYREVLNQLGIENFPIDGEESVLSVGWFASGSRAKGLASRLSDAGVPIEIVERTNQSAAYFLKAEVVTPENEIQGLLKGAKSCEDIASIT